MDLPGIIVVAGGLAAVIGAWHIRYLSVRLRDCDASRLEERERRLSNEARLRKAHEKLDSRKQSISELQRLLNEKSAAMPWVAEMAADIKLAHDERDARRLESKTSPAPNAAAKVRQHALEKKQLRIEKRLVEYRLTLLEHLFPWLHDVQADVAEQIAEKRVSRTDEKKNPLADWLSEDEWLKLSKTERSQLALDRYKKRNKSNWEIGRDFERLVGYHLESAGHDVVYHGAIKGFEDFGRDLIARTKTGKIHFMQCKCWSRRKIIRESVVFQVLGSAIGYYIEIKGHVPASLPTLYECVQPYIISTAPVEPRIRETAMMMGIKIQDDWKTEDWPMVKCNIDPKGNQIYHLPMDQQYDKVKISKAGECYVSTIAEAEAKGFQRAKRWGVGAAVSTVASKPSR